MMMRKKEISNNPKIENSDTLLKLYQIYDNHRNAILWFLEELGASSYKEYLSKYSGASNERTYFIAVCGFFELSGMFVRHGLIDQDLYFDIFNPTPFWKSQIDSKRNEG